MSGGGDTRDVSLQKHTQIVYDTQDNVVVNRYCVFINKCYKYIMNDNKIQW